MTSISTSREDIYILWTDDSTFFKGEVSDNDDVSAKYAIDYDYGNNCYDMRSKDNTSEEFYCHRK